MMVMVMMCGSIEFAKQRLELSAIIQMKFYRVWLEGCGY